MTAANRLTLVRLGLVPLFAILVLLPWGPGRYLAAALFLLAAATDGLDGYLARSRDEVTRLGQLLDPLVDKLLITTALILLVQLHLVPAWVVILIVGREFLISGLRQVAAGEGLILAASSWGKVKTLTQVIAIVALLVEVPQAVLLLYVALVLTMVSALHYLLSNRDLLYRPG
ncbi:CDP-diacylglycerol--glycerol-3-phosphate 3-phosphatidyltransferase [Moorella glycerini]|uniref:CDP-diacylglycerol--glycerol-3-phosphate 3-phosphatidyltransferase n=2 Tax=Neomoorella TaxID=44260 RepID=A0A9X7J1J2_9FIRM|nr:MULTISPECIES: CDP-diacylglycerol--glycerol-3-phosphate 3-phosphatidyltransferase [Moorella]PRR71495.1 CDP-diacylglycerol--glycerol-3-phosphate 3-phosphatidyltransferase [Moorella stamsii]QGP93440.1 CDP-diacylglycerol--glycerol-3-phosphate 3-phosphatidyltransferase [Moorella glycerini]CEP68706.1 CDP-diacylglycerol--glycerol-3-phosphate 3-phosphatidyltransferase [Moorella glycerini]